MTAPLNEQRARELLKRLRDWPSDVPYVSLYIVEVLDALLADRLKWFQHEPVKTLEEQEQTQYRHTLHWYFRIGHDRVRIVSAMGGFEYGVDHQLDVERWTGSLCWQRVCSASPEMIQMFVAGRRPQDIPKDERLECLRDTAASAVPHLRFLFGGYREPKPDRTTLTLSEVEAILKPLGKTNEFKVLIRELMEGKRPTNEEEEE